jgi:hypothetical protein
VCVCLCVCLLNRLTDFHEILYERYAIGGHYICQIF